MIHIFHHVDLDGMGVKILGEYYARSKGQSYKSYLCGYKKINEEVTQCLGEFPEEIIIGDISVTEEVGGLINRAKEKQGLKVRLRDHHETAYHLNKYDWALVKSTDENGVARCGTYWLFQDPEFNEVRKYFEVLVQTIDDWDTWKWKENNNESARKLNSLLTILGHDDFVAYIDNIINRSICLKTPITSPEELFTPETEIMVSTHSKLIDNQVRTCERYLYTMNLWITTSHGRYTRNSFRLKTGIVFLNADISEVGDRLLDLHPEFDLLMLVVFPGNISWRTHKPLPFSLGKLAKKATGIGGGHAVAASSSISISKFTDMMSKFFDNNFDQHIDFSGLRLVKTER